MYRKMELIDKIKNKYKNDGLIQMIKSIFYWFTKIYLLDKIPAYICWPFYKLNRTKFQYNSKNFPLFFHPYNKTWTNERMIELPIINDLIRNTDPKLILEIGNVMSHYMKVEHKILDLYEKGKNIVNQDAANITGMDSVFKQIISISTVEHIGWDCGEKKDPEKIEKTIESIMRCLCSDGLFVFTVPLGYNEYLDKLIKDDYFKNVDYIERTSLRKWVQTNKQNAFKHKFGFPFNAGNALAIIKIKKI